MKNGISIIYKKRDEYFEKTKIKIFGEEFIKNNQKKCKIVINNKEHELMESYNINDNNKKELEIKLIGFDEIKNMSNMFYECLSLSNLKDISNWNTNKVNDMSNMFSRCSSLSNLPDISNWNTNNVTNMANMFYGCSKLSNLPDISNWNMCK